MSMDYIEGGVMMPDTSSKDAELRVLEQKIYAEIPVLLAEKGLSDVQHEAIMDDRKESVELIMRLIKQYGIQERIDSRYQTKITKIREDSKGKEIWGIRIAYDTYPVYTDIATSENEAKEKLAYELTTLTQGISYE